MENIFKTYNNLWEIRVKCQYKYVHLLMDLEDNNILSISSSEITGNDTEPKPHDIWCVSYICQDNVYQKILNTISANIPIVESGFTEIEDKDWVSETQKQFKPIIAGKFFVYSSFYNDQKGKLNKVNIKIDASIAFGTGEHETTQLCLKMLSYLYKNNLIDANNNPILDLGTGTGILAIGAEKLFKGKILACDIDKGACKVAKENSAINKLANKIKIYNNNQNINQYKQRFELITANILLKPLKSLAPQIAQSLQPLGYLVISGILSRQATNIISLYKCYNLQVVHKIEDKNWCAILLRKI